MIYFYLFMASAWFAAGITTIANGEWFNAWFYVMFGIWELNELEALFEKKNEEVDVNGKVD